MKIWFFEKFSKKYFFDQKIVDRKKNREKMIFSKTHFLDQKNVDHFFFRPKNIFRFFWGIPNFHFQRDRGGFSVFFHLACTEIVTVRSREVILLIQTQSNLYTSRYRATIDIFDSNLVRTRLRSDSEPNLSVAII